MADNFQKIAQETRLNCGYKSRVTVYRHCGGIYYTSALAVFDNRITGGYRALGVHFSHPMDAYPTVEEAMADGWDRIAEQSGGHRAQIVLNVWAA